MREPEHRDTAANLHGAELPAELPFPVLLLDPEARVLFAGGVGPELAVEPARGRPLFDCVDPYAADAARACIARVRDSLAADRWLASYGAPDGGQRWYEARVVPRTCHGVLAGFTVALIDVTERVLAERREQEARLAAQRLRDRLELGLELANLSIWEWMPEPGTARRDEAPALGRLSGYADFIERVLPEDRRRVEAAVEQAAGGGDPFSLEFRVKGPGGGVRWLLSRARVEKDATGRVTGVLGVSADITDRRRDDELRRGLEQRAERSQRVESLGRLAGGIAHEFNNLLQMILGTAHMLELSGLAEAQSADLRTIVEAAQRGAELTRQILAFARNDRMVYERTELDDLITRALELLRRVLPENVSVRLESSSDAGELQLDRGRIEQVMMNLCLNARDSMPAGGTIRIRSEHAVIGEVGGPPGLPPGNYAVVHVSDTGSGMAPAVLERVFDPFFTTKPPGQGTGLGLSVAQSIVHKHGGMILAESSPGAGSTFSVYLPRPERAEGTMRRADESAVGRTILVVDDEPIVRDVIGRLLEQGGFRVLFAEDGQAAVERFSEDPNAIDLVIMDAMMPRMGGQAAAARILGLRPGVKLLFLSGYSSSELDQSFLVRHRLTVLIKPVAPAELLSIVRERLADRSEEARGVVGLEDRAGSG